MQTSKPIQDLLDRRANLLGPNVSTFYDDPVHVVRASDVWLWDAEGHKYLDCNNNVAYVGQYNHTRPHQALNMRPPMPKTIT